MSVCQSIYVRSYCTLEEIAVWLEPVRWSNWKQVETPAVQDNEYDDPTKHVCLSLSLSLSLSVTHTGTHNALKAPSMAMWLIAEPKTKELPREYY
jgi:hypothetical protein